MAETLKEYISVSDYAAFIGRTTSQVYNLIKDGIVPSVQFTRGKMKGLLVVKPIGYDEWKNKQSNK